MSQPSPTPGDAPLPSQYLGYFDCFNRGEFFEAHEVLEELWLDCRLAPEGDFFKALIQYAGVFVHLEKRRRAPAASLCRRALQLLARYPGPFLRLDTEAVRESIEATLRLIEAGADFADLLIPDRLPRLCLGLKSPSLHRFFPGARAGMNAKR